MKIHSIISSLSAAPGRALLAVVAAVIAPALLMTGCQTTSPTAIPTGAHPAPVALVLHEADMLKISFPGAHNLDTAQPVRRDGMITMPLIGELKAVGLTPAELEKTLIEKYGTQLVVKEVTVLVEPSAFPIYITGAVLKPGKIVTDHPLTILEAVMEAGGFDLTKANVKNVTIIRTENGVVRHYRYDLRGVVLEGHDGPTITLSPADIIYVPERFTWF